MSETISITWPRRRPFKNVLQFKITLNETDPPIWRRIQVPDSYTFYDLHVAIQDGMGWMDSHLHDFRIVPRRAFNLGIRIECPFAIEEIEEKAPLLTTEIRVSDFLDEPGDRSLYDYDYGDGWEHDVVLEGIISKDPDRPYPLCLAGELACPPEDCGGIPGYYDCIKALKARDNSEGLLDWLGSWRPDRFDPAEVKFWRPATRLRKAMRE